MFLVIGYLAYRRGTALTKQSQPELMKPSRPESIHIRNELKKSSDSASREIPSQSEVKRRASQVDDDRNPKQHQRTPRRGSEEWLRRTAEIDVQYGDDAQNWFHKWNDGLID